MIDLEAVVLWLNGLSPECRISLGGMACHRWGLQAVDVWVFDAWWVRGAWVVHVGVLNLPRIQAFSKPALWHFAFRLLKLIQKIERLCVCSFLVTFVTATVLVSLRGHSASHFSVALVALRLTCLSIWQALGAQQRIRLAGGTTTTPGALEQTCGPSLEFFLSRSRWCCYLLANYGMNRYSQSRFLAFTYIWLLTLPGRCLTAVLFAGSLAGGTLRCLVAGSMPFAPTVPLIQMHTWLNGSFSGAAVLSTLREILHLQMAAWRLFGLVGGVDTQYLWMFMIAHT